MAGKGASPGEDGVKLNLHMRADASGILHVEKAEAVVEVVEEYTVKVLSSLIWLLGTACPRGPLP